MTAFRNGILQKTSTPRYSDLQLRASAILNEYENACTWAAEWRDRAAAADDLDLAEIAADWYAALKPLKIRAQRLYKAVNAHETRKRCDAYVAKREAAWEAGREDATV